MFERLIVKLSRFFVGFPPRSTVRRIRSGGFKSPSRIEFVSIPAVSCLPEPQLTARNTFTRRPSKEVHDLFRPLAPVQLQKQLFRKQCISVAPPLFLLVIPNSPAFLCLSLSDESVFCLSHIKETEVNSLSRLSRVVRYHVYIAFRSSRFSRAPHNIEPVPN